MLGDFKEWREKKGGTGKLVADEPSPHLLLSSRPLKEIHQSRGGQAPPAK
jgi:hypothetical protein